MTVKEAAIKCDIDLNELEEKTTEYFKSKMARKEYRKYKYNKLVQKRLYEDCLSETLLSMASSKGKLNLILGGKQ
uniref:Uncharacterized protein n=1 Tax=Myoviridae sp. ctRRy11 TaxID=2826651 RepID=A0A8S5MXW7_9CAUD|nr:MAG TPA: hypothetical protein [Myoviridae sp. ctRRy11]